MSITPKSTRRYMNATMYDSHQTILHSLSSFSPTGLRSRVLAVSIPEHLVLWTSDLLSGQNMGSPVFYRTRNGHSYIAITHNSDEILAEDNSTAKNGHFTLLRTGEC